MVGVAALVVGTGFLAVQEFGLTQRVLPVPVAIALDLPLVAGTALALGTWSRRQGWTPVHRFAAVTGAVLTYAGYGFVTQEGLRGLTPTTIALQGAIAAVAVGLLALALRATRGEAEVSRR